MKYSEVYARVINAGFPPLNEDHIRYSLEQGRVRWAVRFDKVNKHFRSLELALAFRDGCKNKNLIKPVFIQPEPKNRNVVARPYNKREYSYEPLLLGPGKIITWD